MSTRMAPKPLTSRSPGRLLSPGYTSVTFSVLATGVSQSCDHTPLGVTRARPSDVAPGTTTSPSLSSLPDTLTSACTTPCALSMTFVSSGVGTETERLTGVMAVMCASLVGGLIVYRG